MAESGYPEIVDEECDIIEDGEMGFGDLVILNGSPDMLVRKKKQSRKCNVWLGQLAAQV